MFRSLAIVCQCANVSRGCLSQAIQSGHCSVETLGAATGASTVCGSCKPLVTELLGNTVIEAEPDAKVLVSTAVVTLLLAFAFLLLPAIPSADSVQLPWRWDALWRDSLLKQITGFSVLGAACLISLISLRKRTKRIAFGAFPTWRGVHVVLGTLVLGTLVAHTGLHLGDKLNLFLMLDFLALLLAGTLAGATIGLQHRLPSYTTKRVRSLSLWAHILLLWPLPALLGFHVLKSYWF